MLEYNIPEYVRGLDLSRLLEQEGPFTRARVVPVECDAIYRLWRVQVCACVAHYCSVPADRTGLSGPKEWISRWSRQGETSVGEYGLPCGRNMRYSKSDMTAQLLWWRRCGIHHGIWRWSSFKQQSHWCLESKQ